MAKICVWRKPCPKKKKEKLSFTYERKGLMEKAGPVIPAIKETRI